MKKIIIKIETILVLFLLFLNGSVFAFFEEKETSLRNFLQAGTLDLSLKTNSSNFYPELLALNMTGGSAVTRKAEIENKGTLPFYLNLSFKKISGDEDFCQALWLIVKKDEETIYDGKLKDLNLSSPLLLKKGEKIELFFNLFLFYGNSFLNKICDFDIEFKAWQDNVSFFDQSSFNDRESFSSHLLSYGLRINEVYFDVADDKGEEIENEWIEIYNQTESEIDLSSFKICDNSGCDSLPSELLQPKSFALISPNSSTWNFWEIPQDVLKISLSSPIGNGLSNSGDRVLLKRKDDILIDALSYGNDNSIFDPPLNLIEEGHSFSRKIEGYDTDKVSDFEDLALPTPGR